MTKTGTQNRPYTDQVLMVRAIFQSKDPRVSDSAMDFNWNNRDEVRRFAAMSDAHICAGGSTILKPH